MHPFRMLARGPGFFAVAILTLVLGISLNTCAFSIMNALWFKPLPFQEPQSLVVVRTAHLKRGSLQLPDYDEFIRWRATAKTMEQVEAIEQLGFNLGLRNIVPGTAPQRVSGAGVSAGFVEMLGYRPITGRLFTAADFKPGAASAALISEKLWRTRLDARPEVLGARVTLDGRDATVVGVLPYRFRFLFGGYDVVVPLADAPGNQRRWLEVAARLKPRTTLEQAQAEITAIARTMELENPSARAGLGARVQALSSIWMADARRMYPVLIAAAALVLLVVCGNLSNIVLARSIARRREMAIRAAMGASRRRLVKELMSESLLIGAAGGLLALLVCLGAEKLLIAGYPELADLTIDFRVAGATLAAAAAACVVFGLGPALAGSRPDLVDTLKSGGNAGSTRGVARMRSLLVASQMAVAVAMLGGAALLVRCVFNTRQADPGFPTAGLAVTEISLPDASYSTPEKRMAFLRSATERLGGLPGVHGAAAASALPMWSGPEFSRIEVEGRTGRPEGDFLSALYTPATPGFLELLKIPLLRGGTLKPEDRAGGQRVAVINDAMRRALWADGSDPVGRRIRVAGSDWLLIVGVAGDARQDLLRPAAPQVFVPAAQDPPRRAWIALRTSLAADALRAPIRAAIGRIDPDLPTGEVRSMESLKQEYLPRVVIVGIGVFATVTLILAGIGMYGVTSYLVTQRTREFGIRIALGADAKAVAGCVGWRSMRVAAAGGAVGLAGSLGLGRLLSVSIWGISAADPLALGAVAAVLMGVVLAATFAPARRAIRIDPAQALRAD